MNKFWKKKWVEALESGDYKQAQGSLKEVANKKTVGFCCLGVICDVAGAKWKGSFAQEYRSAHLPFTGETQSAWLSPEALAAFDISDNEQSVLMDMNDRGNTFKDIAAYIRKKL